MSNGPIRKLATMLAVVVSMLVFAVVVLVAMVAISALLWGTR